MKKILVIDDDVDICTLLSRFLGKKGFEVATAHTGNQAVELLKKQKYDLVVSDYRLGDLDGTEMLGKIKELYPEVPVIIITGYSDIKTAVNVIKGGAFDYVTKPLLPDEILHTIHKALDSQDEQSSSPVRVKTKTTSSTASLPQFLRGESSRSKELYKQIELVAPTNYSVMVFGETGTGKEAVAQTIHALSPRKDKPFIAMDCGALSKELAGSEMFGHVKGAFTGAIMDKIGHFELANGGTLFLDEVANLTYEVQVALLRVIQERKMKRIGGTKEVTLDVRLIVASNENLYEAVQKGRFREDLYHRFNEFGLQVPALRERGSDIMLFGQYFLTLANNDLDKEVKGFSDDVKEAFSTYDWPGNLREMKNVVKRAALLAQGEIIETKHLPVEIANAQQFKEAHIRAVAAGVSGPSSMAAGGHSGKEIDLKTAAKLAEYEMIMNVLRQTNFNRTKAAQILNIDRKTLYNKMVALNINT
jgi:two-component system response regulator HydG